MQTFLDRTQGLNFKLGLVAFFAALVVACFWVFTWHSYNALRADQWAESETHAEQTRLAFAAHVTRLLDYGDSYLRSARYIYQHDRPIAETLRQDMAAVKVPHAAAFTGVVLVFDESGRMVFHTEEVAHLDVNVAERSFFRALRDDPTDRLIVDPTRMGLATAQLQFRLARPLLKAGRFAGAIVLTMKPEHIIDYYRDLNLGRHAASMLLTTDLEVIAREPAAKDEDYAGPIPGLKIWRGHDLATEPTGKLRQQSVIDGMMRTFHYAKLPDYPLVVSIGVADADVDALIARTRQNLFLLALAFGLTVAVVASLLMAFMRTNRNLTLANRASQQAAEQVQKTNIRLQRTNMLLERSNADLEQFAYVASHDLQSPLRNMASFAQLLEQRYGSRLDADGRDFIGFIVAGAQQMSSLITDLLDYSRVSSQGKPLTPVAAAGAVATALAAIGAAVQHCGATVTVGALPEVLADEGQLARLFQNLIENALKYRHPERAPEIRIWAEADDHGLWRFFVADNGIGIDPAYFDKIFIIFQRLHPVGQYEGTGIGLAVCKRIVNRMGGEIGVSSAPGEGTTFFFTAHAPGADLD